MFEGKRFLPLTGIPIWKIARSRTVFAVWLPEPLTVAIWMLKSFRWDVTMLPYVYRSVMVRRPGLRT